jgi:hypothetical protein
VTGSNIIGEQILSVTNIGPLWISWAVSFASRSTRKSASSPIELGNDASWPKLDSRVA